ncbi:MAG: hypothetical protein UV58_C0026G0004 [Candidatus Wolfebacteria bacterium GW2011_GWC1_43_10]|uniref:Uncharacterized protein n=1 Tax=Candidatus Wolfebacteria bacterium GW2011_GWC1_43_10 TaxID=1619011 RepID=A0A0G1C717_9BACT|nr:MAG: hypothetical protein UV58_C0026G0004 [Candidatus Wolfebacteria bacterium GW2011_GWC1_43_10]
MLAQRHGIVSSYLSEIPTLAMVSARIHSPLIVSIQMVSHLLFDLFPLLVHFQLCLTHLTGARFVFKEIVPTLFAFGI